MTTATRPLCRVEVTPKRPEVHLSLHAGQRRAWESERRFVFMLAGSQGGKTSLGPHWLLREIQRCGPGDYLAVTSTFPLLKLKMLPEFLRIFRDLWRLGEWKASDRTFQFHNDETRIIFGSATNANSLESATAKGAWLDEVGQDDFRLESWEAILRRLSIHQGRVLGGTTVYNLGWLKSEVYEPWQRGDPDFDVIQFDSTLNPLFPRSEFERARRVLPDWKFQMFYRGLFAKPAGLVYHDFDDRLRAEGGHVVAPFTIPAHWPRYVGFDFGGANTASVWLAHDPQADVFYVYHETLEGDLTTREHAARALHTAAGVNVVAWRGGAKSESQQRRDYNAAGVPLQAPDIFEVEPGIDRVTALWKTHRLYVFEDCRGLRDELGTYARKLDNTSEPTAKIKDKERYHRLDALRYVAQALDVAEPTPPILLTRTSPWRGLGGPTR